MNNQERLFWKQFKRWHLDDIERAIKAEAYVGAAKLICCAIDAFAGFRFGAVRYPGSKFRFISFVKEFMPNFKYRLLAKRNGRVIYKRSILEMLYNNFRSGLIHEGLPGVGTNIFEDQNTNLLFKTPKPDMLEINILGLFEYLKFAIGEYEKRLTEKDILNSFRERFKFISDKGRIPKIQ
ncbi:MAG: hypothetical protein A2784_02310 [Candidatus Chisholmbacteria bacterium RIFCSPHIGHO2_01_FULL_48_12]|uniref:Apea-like HEPN domain-containing protein n=1 Tax=Candidatus Chisholmbacteria bacterium RIFCSPHIGHO2_01_FULL_48_12 TaxID=1797589 RepID=A0A1G1VJB8_9BACT|nr:MAG: hypothetical protein A2784_02310 [Candidatus Chisholmbacteria bacterium RIFCSPHIGHO2_01_FULL_48_12]